MLKACMSLKLKLSLNVAIYFIISKIYKFLNISLTIFINPKMGYNVIVK